MSSRYTRMFSLLLVAALFLAGCEQTMINGPVADAAVTLTDVRSGAVLTSGTQFTDNVEDAVATYAEAFDGFGGLQQLSVLGITRLNTLPVDPQRWYLVSMEGGFDLDVEQTLTVSSATQVFGTVHALMSGTLIDAGGHVVGPLSEAAYQWVSPYIDVMTDAELSAALDEYATQLVIDVRLGDDEINYQDLLTYNSMYHPGSFIGSTALLEQMKNALAAGDGDAVKAQLAADLVNLAAPLNAGKALFREVVSPEISQVKCIACHVAGGSAGGTRHVLERTTNADHINLNVAMYTNLVDALGVTGIVNKAMGQNHGGGMQLMQGSADLQNLQTFLGLL